MLAITKLGNVTPKVANTIHIVSGHLLYFRAAIIPRSIPKVKEITTATPPSFADAGKE